jgi:hypothetical protein
MDAEIANGNGKASYADYKRIISDYLIPILGSRNVTNIDGAALDMFDQKRIELMERTLLGVNYFDRSATIILAGLNEA